MLPLTRHGLRELLIGSVVLILLAAGLGWVFHPLALIVLPVLIFLFAFFRDPERTVPAEQHAVVSPADGTVSDITEMEYDKLIGGLPFELGFFFRSLTLT